MGDAAADLLAGSAAGPRGPWRPVEWLALAAGWAVAAAAGWPAGPPADPGSAWLALGAAVLFWPIVIAVVRSDLRHFIIPDEASAAIAALGLAVAAGGPWLSGEGGGEMVGAVLEAMATGAGSFALFWAIGAAFRRMRRDALGFGDVKLAGACALWLSPGDAALALECAALGAIAALLLGRRGRPLRDTAVPFGAFLAPAAWLVVVLAPPLRDAGWLP